ncbi:MAG: histidine kinase [Actinoplanes sp.]
MKNAWRIWLPPLLVIMVGMAQVAFARGRIPEPPTDGQLILVLTGALALLFRLHRPVEVTIVAVLTGAALPAFGQHLILIDVAAIVAVYTVASTRPRRTVVLTTLLAVVLLTASSAIWVPGHLANIGNLLPVNYVVVAAALGSALRDRRALLEQLRERAAEAERTRESEAARQVQEERIRIARDLHDVVAHHITLVNAQAGVAHHLLDAHPDQARQALAGIRDTTRTALDELRATVQLLRQDGDPPESRQPAPGFADLDGLLAGFRSAGFDVRVTRGGTAGALTGSADLAAYRIVQEALTNAGKHGSGESADLGLHYTATHLEITVRNPTRSGQRGPGTGHGLIGMRERAHSAGGEVTTGLSSDGTFEVKANLPLRTA